MTISPTKGMTYAVAAAALATALAACGGSGGGTANTLSGGSGTTSTASAHTGGLTVKSTGIGSVVADPQGRTVYELVGDPPSNPKCTGECQTIWPPVMAAGHLVVVHGHPVFTYSGDSAPGQTKGQGLKDSWGTWLALNPQGAAIPAGGSSAPQSGSSGSSGSTGGGGYGY